jgi:acetyl esterase/lipase
MCDFARYGNLCDEWLRIQDPTAPTPAETDILTMKMPGNQSRVEFSAKEMSILSPMVRTQDYMIPTRDRSSIQARTYRPAGISDRAPLYIHFHGGGFLVGTLQSEDAICSQIALEAAVVVVNIKYRHTPDYTYPTAWHDAQDAFSWIHSHNGELNIDLCRVIIGNISAGAGLAASLTLAQHLKTTLEPCPSIAGQILMIPALVHMDCYGPQLNQMVSSEVLSYAPNEFAPILPVKRARLFTDLLRITNPQGYDTLLNPANVDRELACGLPPTVFGIAGADPLRDEGLLYAKKLFEAG